MEIYQHVLKKVMEIHNEDEIESFSKWMTYRVYENFTDLCIDFHYILIFIIYWAISITTVTTEWMVQNMP